MSIFTLILLIIFTAQVYWVLRIRAYLHRKIGDPKKRIAIGSIIGAFYLFVLAYNFGIFGPGYTPVRLTAGQALLVAPFRWWAASCVFAFLIAMILGAGKLLLRRVNKQRGRPQLESPERRVFLARTAGVIVAAPYIAGAYGLLYGRLNLETSHRPIAIPRLPVFFEGFRIAQLSDIHIGPFMPEDEIRKYVAIANALKPDLTVVTGDFVTSDPRTQEPVVAALAGLHAPFGVYGCLGNHDAWSGVEDSITELFRQVGIRILRTERVAIRGGGDEINLLGVDFQSERRFGPSAAVPKLLANIEGLITRDRVNILLSHNPDTFDRAAELGIELSLAGHTHGGQAALEFISPEIAPSRLATPYVSGLFQKPGGQLYVNRGIGTIGIPIRVGAPPEITLYELKRA
jgi:predicted MPP superfamily phosphohydrolase